MVVKGLLMIHHISNRYQVCLLACLLVYVYVKLVESIKYSTLGDASVTDHTIKRQKETVMYKCVKVCSMGHNNAQDVLSVVLK